MSDTLQDIINEIKTLAGEPYRFSGYNEIGVALLKAADKLDAQDKRIAELESLLAEARGWLNSRSRLAQDIDSALPPSQQEALQDA